MLLLIAETEDASMAHAPSVVFNLNEVEEDTLLKPLKGQGGYQSLITRLRKKFNASTKDLSLSDADMGAIVRYINYSQGGYQNDLRLIFKRNFCMIMVSWLS